MMGAPIPEMVSSLIFNAIRGQQYSCPHCAKWNSTKTILENDRADWFKCPQC